jgi:hypothetical protein
MRQEHNKKVKRRAQVLSVLDNMGVEIQPRITIQGTQTTTMTEPVVTKPISLPADAPEMVGIANEFGDAGVPSLIPPTIQSREPAIASWTQEEILRYIRSPSGYAAYLQNGGYNIPALDLAVEQAQTFASSSKSPQLPKAVTQPPKIKPVETKTEEQPPSVMKPLEPPRTQPPKPSGSRWPWGDKMRVRRGGGGFPDEPPEPDPDPDPDDENNPWDDDPWDDDPDDDDTPKLDFDKPVEMPEDTFEMPDPMEIESGPRPTGRQLTAAQKAAAKVAAAIAAASGVGGAIAAESTVPKFRPNIPIDPETGLPQMPKGNVGPMDPNIDPVTGKPKPKPARSDPEGVTEPTSSPTTPFDPTTGPARSDPEGAPTSSPTEDPTEPTEDPEDPAQGSTGTAVPGVTERKLMTSADPAVRASDAEPDLEGELRPMMLIEGSNDVKQTEEEDRVNDQRIMDEIVLTGTEWEDRKNPLKIRDQQNLAIRYYKTSVRNPLYVGDPGNFINLSKFSRPSARVRNPKGSKYYGRPYMANPGQIVRETQYSNVFKPNEATSGIRGTFPFHSIYSNMNYPSLPDRKIVF